MAGKKDIRKTKKQLIEELESLRHQVSEMETSQNVHRQASELSHIIRMNSPIGVFVVQDGRFIFTNKRFQRANGMKGGELMGTRSLERVSPEDREMVRENAIKMLNGEFTAPYTYRITNQDGQIRWMLEGVTSIQYRGRRAVLGHALDITDRMVAEAELRKLYENEKKLRQELEAEVQKRIEFTRAMVHELKTPLTPVLFSSELLVEELHREPWASVARNIHRGAENLNHRIDDLLDLARVEIGILQLNPKPIEPLQLLKTIADYVKALLKKNDQNLVLDVPPSLPELWADEERLQQIILNLLVNASKFTPEGGTITLAARQKDESLMVLVKDTGVGIPKKEQKRIFQPYQRQSPDRERLSGLGLGLSLCKNLVELQGGNIWVESHNGKGSTFTFTIPLKPPAPASEPDTKEQKNEVTGHRG